jgi:hypothetical protein
MIILPWYHRARLALCLVQFSLAYSRQWNGRNHTATLHFGLVKLHRIRPARSHLTRLGLPVL